MGAVELQCVRDQTRPFTDLAVAAIEEVTGRKPELCTSGGTSDARFIASYCPVIEFGLVGQTMHQIDERTPVVGSGEADEDLSRRAGPVFCVSWEQRIYMQKRSISAVSAPQPKGSYAQVCEVSDARRWAFVSGQIPQAVDGTVPTDFTAQARLVWINIEAQLGAVDMTLANIVKVTTFLSDRKYNLQNRTVRNEVLSDLAPALDRDYCRYFRRCLAAGDRGHRGGLTFAVLHPHQI